MWKKKWALGIEYLSMQMESIARREFYRRFGSVDELARKAVAMQIQPRQDAIRSFINTHIIPVNGATMCPYLDEIGVNEIISKM